MKKTFALCLALLLLLGLLPCAALGADSDVVLAASVSSVQAGESFVVTLTVPAVGQAAAAHFKISFNKNLFELTAFTPPSISSIRLKSGQLMAPTRTATTPGEANQNGYFSVSWLGVTSSEADNTMNMSAALTIQATFTARTGVVGGGAFTIEVAEADWYNTATHLTENRLTLPEETTVWVDLYEELSAVNITGLNAPAKGALLDKTIDPIRGVSAAIEWYAGGEVTGGQVSGFADGGQVYTVLVKLTAQPGRRFAQDLTFPGFTTVSAEETQIILRKTYPATDDRTLVRLAVSHGPNVTSYVHGDALDTAGLSLTATYDDGTVLPVSDYTLSYAAGSFLRAGDTSVTAAYGGMTAAVTGLSVARRSLTVSGLDAVDRAYDGTTTVEISGGVLSGAVSGDAVSLTMPRYGTVLNAGAGTGKAVSLDTLYLFGNDAGYYTLTQPSLTVDIAKADLKLAHFNVTRPKDKVYDKRPAAIVKPALKGTYQSEGLTVAVFCNGEAMETSPSAVGYYLITFTVPDGGANFNAHPDPMTLGGFDITTAPVTVAGAGAASGTYGQTLGEMRITGLAADAAGTWAFDAPDTVLYAGTGTQAATFTPLDGNYGTAKASVAVTVGAAAQSPAVTASADLIVGGKELDLSTLVTGAQGAVSFAIKSGSAATLSGTKLTSGNAPGDVTVTVRAAAKDLNGDGTPEYAAWTGDGAITVHVVNKADAQVSISGASSLTKAYGDGAFSLTASAAAPGSGTGAWTWSSSNAAAVSVDGSGKVTILGAGSAGVTAKYESGSSLGLATVNITVKKAPLTVTAKNSAITYGSAPAGAGVTYAGFVNGDTEAVLTGTLTYTYTYSRYGAVGKYALTPAGLGAANYAITFAGGTLTVGQKAVGLSWGESTFTYDGSEKLPEASATGLVNGDACTVTVTGAQISAGTYTATAAALSNANYKLPASGLTHSFTIGKAADPAVLTGTAVTVNMGTTAELAGLVQGAMGKVSFTVTTPLPGCSVDERGVFTPGRTAGTCVVTVKTGDSANHTGKTVGKITVTVVNGTSVTGSLKSGKLSYTTKLVPAGAVLIAARYEGGKMTWSKTVSAPGASGTLTPGGSGGNYRLFLVDGSTCAPLCPAWGN